MTAPRKPRAIGRSGNLLIALISIAILAAALVAIRQIDAALRSNPPLVTGEPGALLYAAGFDGFADEWATYDGRLSANISEGALRIRVGDVQSGPFVPTRWQFADADLRIQARAVDGPLNNGFGVVFRLRDSANYYAFLISSDGFYKIVRSLDGVSKDLSAWIRSDLVQQGLSVDNTLHVMAQGDRFTFFINDGQVSLCLPDDPDAQSTYYLGECLDGSMHDSLTDSTHKIGHIGVIAITLNEPDVTVAFDNLTVFQPE